MSDFSGFSLLVLFAGLIALFLPFIFPIYYAVFQGHGIKGRWIFVLVSPLVTASLFLLALLLIAPFTWMAVLVTPSLKHIFDHLPFWTTTAEGIAKYWGLFFPFCWGVLGFFVTKFIWNRWSAICQALVQPPKK